jgi:hypothetical protein
VVSGAHRTIQEGLHKMKKRPILLVVLAALHFLEPLFKILFLKAQTGFEWTVIFDNIFSINSPKAIFEFWLLFPIAGAAIIGAKKWSYSLFVTIQCYSVYAHLTYQKFTWPYVAETPFISHTLLLVFNLLVIAYFLLPDVRRIFFEPGLRWWETPTRYYFDLPCAVTFGDSNNLVDVKIKNISRTGCFIGYMGEVTDGQPLTLHLTYGKFDIKLPAEVVRKSEFQGQQGIGVKFHYQNIWDMYTLRRMLGEIEKSEFRNDDEDNTPTQAAA